MLDLFNSNWTTAPRAFNFSIASAVGFGHPLLSAGPAISGHLSF
jgi:hypothetical protein